MAIIEGAARGLTTAGAPVNGTDEIQTLTIDATGGTFTLVFDGRETAPITWSATNNTLIANIDTALEALPNIGTGGVTCADATLSSGVGTLTITFAGAGTTAKRAQNLITVGTNSLTGTAALSIAETTPGVSASGLGAAKGTLLTDTTNGKLYINTGTAAAPTWTVVGSQS